MNLYRHVRPAAAWRDALVHNGLHRASRPQRSGHAAGGRHRVIATLVAAAMCAGGVATVGVAVPAFSQVVRLLSVDVKEVAKGWRTTKLHGSAVVNDKDEKIGSIDDIIIGKDKVLFAVIQVGGFLGLGGHLIATPFERLQLDDEKGKIVLPGASKDELSKLPEFRYLT
ncbi:PRC-barrel domain-containing protein [Methylobacterium fujisawaense]|uniref:PRC-barrel domain-containing protein n=1 Tax=Methylobacterium fujisawaense TaxID=107400 RepID=UPI0031F5363E